MSTFVDLLFCVILYLTFFFNFLVCCVHKVDLNSAAFSSLLLIQTVVRNTSIVGLLSFSSISMNILELRTCENQTKLVWLFQYYMSSKKTKANKKLKLSYMEWSSWCNIVNLTDQIQVIKLYILRYFLIIKFARLIIMYQYCWVHDKRIFLT